MSNNIGGGMNQRTGSHPTRKAVLYFLISLSVCIGLSCITIRHKLDLQQLSMEQIIVEKSIKITGIISKLLYKTQALAALVIQSDGEIRDFSRIAATIADDPAILNILLAPSGRVSDVYPSAGNKKLIGYNLLGEGAGNREAALSKEMGELVFGGPFELMQGGMGLVGRLPVWLERDGNNKVFWGIVSVTLRYPEALNGAGLESLAREGFSYEIWRINPDDGQPQIIASSVPGGKKDMPYIEQNMRILNANWRFRIMPIRHWYQFPEHWGLIAAGFCISLLIGMLTHNNEDLKRMKGDLEIMVRTDTLTGIPNRAGLFQALEAMLRKGHRFYLYYFDLDYFKQINDTFGHSTGDMVLIEFCRRVGKHLTKNHTLARISGDEFVLLFVPPLVTREKDLFFWEYLTREFKTPILSADGSPIVISYSKGMASYPEDGTTLDSLLARADQRMYEEKQNKYARDRKRRAADLKIG